MSLTLAMDTTGVGAVVALAEDGEGLAVAKHDVAGGYAESLFGLFDQVLERASRNRNDVTRVAVVSGPGSFTGVRIGVMTAKSWAFAAGAELWACRAPELAAAVASHRLGTQSVAVVQPAGRGAVTVSVHAGDRVLQEPQRCLVGELADVVESDAPLCAVGDPKLGAELSPQVSLEELASSLAAFASAGRVPAEVADPATLVPFYVAPSQAERAHGVDLREDVHRPRPWS